jgi:hypothetical protein
MQLRDYEAGHLKGVILSEGQSKYRKQASNQLSLF